MTGQTRATETSSRVPGDRFRCIVLWAALGASLGALCGGCGSSEVEAAEPTLQQTEDAGHVRAPAMPAMGEAGGASGESVAPTARISLLLVVDESGSMAETPAGYEVSKWEALTGALSSSLSGLPDDVWVGVELFPTTAAADDPIPFQCGDTARCCEMPSDSEMNVDVAPASVAVPMITETLDSSGPAGGTPATVALQRAHDYFANGDGQALTGERFVLLVLDGIPNCNPDHPCASEDCGPCTLDPSLPGDPPLCCYGSEACDDSPDSAATIQSLREAGVQTMVVGIPGSELYSDSLDALATAGGLPNPDGEQAHYVASAEGGTAELEATLGAALGAIVR